MSQFTGFSNQIVHADETIIAFIWVLCPIRHHCEMFVMDPSRLSIDSPLYSSCSAGDDPWPIDEASGSPARSTWLRACLHHVFRAGGMISGMLLTWHNLNYYQELMGGMRAAIAGGTFAEFQVDFHAHRAQGDIEPL